jgi:hypothetical protein
MSVIFNVNAVAMLEAILTGSAHAYKILRCGLGSQGEPFAASTDSRCERIDVALALKSFEVACRVILRGRVGVENGELKVGVHGAHLNEESTDAAHGHDRGS